MSKEDKKQYLVTATFTDKETGDTVLPGSYFAATEQRARRLQAAGVIADDDTGTPVEPDPIKPALEADKKPGKAKANKNDAPSLDDGGDNNNGDADNPTEG
ncbi:hypothetical protein [Paenibacillus sp. NRS-1780]|uniref:hypothetical protein n=1 Tax=Paenibacillus sp. NRS-1780 TaxID=3233904 RepID=UPI003D2AF884